MKKWIWLAAVAVIAAGIWIYHMPREIHHELKGIIYSVDGAFEQPAEIIVTGKKYPDPFGKPVMKGTVSIDGLFQVPVTMVFDGTSYFCAVTESGDDKVQITKGTVYASRELDRFWIQLDEIRKHYGIKDAYVFAPAMYRGEANASIEEMLKD